ncbi:3c1c125b-bded-4642-9d05-df9f32c32def [Thermothielavioides terrestris]|uniref:3c1c125b-bded-4642-9d05-df9f32c32def n=1 Tax=Thermothielavioides terrestris TaxID=2587410 RepID=A0A446BDH6_9PEZI|nr:3c1c125b-bded-4642-9d05-df9f32c32def [Thermothielavioides terrestris]
MRAMSLKAADEGLLPAQKNHRDQTCKLQARIWGLRQGMYRQPAVPTDFLASFDYDLQELVGNTVKMDQAVDTLAAELKNALADLDRVRELEATIQDLRREVEAWKQRHAECKHAATTMAARNEEDIRRIKHLTEQLRQSESARTILQQQVNNKRNLWLTLHDDPDERAAALSSLTRSATPLSGQTLAAPPGQGYMPSMMGSRPGSAGTFSSGFRSGGSSDRSGSIAHQGSRGSLHGGNFHFGVAQPFQGIPSSRSASAAAFHGPSQPWRRPSTATPITGSDLSSMGPAGGAAPLSRPPSGLHRGARVPATEETGSPKERKRTVPVSLVRADPKDTESIAWAEEFEGFFALVYGFCSSYFYDLPQMAPDWKAHIMSEADGGLWDYICGICQTNQDQTPGDHALRLLQDPESRTYLLQRLLLQHIVLSIFTYEGWKDYSDDIDDEMERLEKDLAAVKPTKSHERQAILDRRARLVAEMSEGSNAAAFKNYKVTQHHQQLKSMMAPFLPRRTGKNHNITNEAFFDLYTITTTAWELSAKLFRSRLTFQWTWTDVGVLFTADTQEPVDCPVDRLLLQHERWRVKLCATPAVTLRNDQGMTITIKNILKSGVLLMRN